MLKYKVLFKYFVCILIMCVYESVWKIDIHTERERGCLEVIYPGDRVTSSCDLPVWVLGIGLWPFGRAASS